MKKKAHNKHEFALWYSGAALLNDADQKYLLQDEDLTHRLINVLRVAVDDSVLLFDATHHILCTVVSVTKKGVMVQALERRENFPLKPAIIWLLPLLERDSFEEALYALAAMGATEIQPVITEKSRRNWGAEKEYDRALRIMIAAAEQSKQFALPRIHAPLELTAAVRHATGAKIFFDASGAPTYEVVTQLRSAAVAPYTCLVGPEGDLSEQEKAMVRDNGFLFCKLTPTILKASAAVEVGMGIMRSCLTSPF